MQKVNSEKNICVRNEQNMNAEKMILLNISLDNKNLYNIFFTSQVFKQLKNLVDSKILFIDLFS